MLPHDEVFRACESMTVACPHANWPQMACSRWMIHQWADFWLLLSHYQFSPLLLAEVLNLVPSLGLFCMKMSPGQGDQSWQKCALSSLLPDPSLVTLPQQMPAAVGLDHPGDTPWATRWGARESSWTRSVGGLFSLVGNGTHPHLSETTHRAQRADLWVGAGWVEGKRGLAEFPWRFY